MTETKIVSAELKPEDKIKTVRDLIVKSRAQFEMALPKYMNVDRLIRVAMTSLQRNPALLDCHPTTLIGALMQSAQLGLEPDDITGAAYLVPFFNTKKNRREVQLIPGYRGLIGLAKREGDVVLFESVVVHEKDVFSVERGTNPSIRHVPADGTDTGKPTHFYAIATMTNGMKQFEVMTVAEVDIIRSRAQGKNSPAWVDHYEEMGKKSVSRRLCKIVGKSQRLQRAVTLDERAEIGIPQDLAILADPLEHGTENGEKLAEPLKKPEAKLNG